MSRQSAFAGSNSAFLRRMPKPVSFLTSRPESSASKPARRNTSAGLAAFFSMIKRMCDDVPRVTMKSGLRRAGGVGTESQLGACGTGETWKPWADEGGGTSGRACGAPQYLAASRYSIGGAGTNESGCGMGGEAKSAFMLAGVGRDERLEGQPPGGGAGGGGNGSTYGNGSVSSGRAILIGALGVPSSRPRMGIVDSQYGMFPSRAYVIAHFLSVDVRRA